MTEPMNSINSMPKEATETTRGVGCRGGEPRRLCRSAKPGRPCAAG